MSTVFSTLLKLIAASVTPFRRSSLSCLKWIRESEADHARWSAKLALLQATEAREEVTELTEAPKRTRRRSHFVPSDAAAAAAEVRIVCGVCMRDPWPLSHLLMYHDCTHFTGSIAFDCGFGRAWHGPAPDVGGRSHQRLSRQPDKGGLRPKFLKIHFALCFWMLFDQKRTGLEIFRTYCRCLWLPWYWVFLSPSQGTHKACLLGVTKTVGYWEGLVW